uniref:Uncharacterized protein n=1 Tax=Anguilla anguilla TaxID=7936 RepID=A0A0E9S927_ANGAN
MTYCRYHQHVSINGNSIAMFQHISTTMPYLPYTYRKFDPIKDSTVCILK